MHFSPVESGEGVITAVAIDRDKNSQQAVKWTVDHLLTNNPRVTLVHVRLKNNATSNHSASSGHSAADTSSEGSSEQLDEEMQQLFLPYRGFCARKGMQMKEVVLEDIDVSKALIDYVTANTVQNIVVGASNRNALTRKFLKPDVATCLIKSTPEYCAVYVIAKGKPIHSRTAKGSVPNSAMPPRQSMLPQPLHEQEPARPSKGQSWRGQFPPSPQPERRSFDKFSDSSRSSGRERPGSRSTPTNHFLDSIDSPAHGLSSRFSDFTDSFSDDSLSMGRQSIDFENSTEFSASSSEIIGGASPPPSNYKDVEAEMKRLRLELKQTMDMYSNACKEAISAKQKAKELDQWKMEETRKYEELRSAEEAALAMAEIEKAKCKAALEAAEAAKKIAEFEAQKRMTVEMQAKHETEEKKKALSTIAHHTDIRYRKYTIEEIESATSNFSDNLKVGEGGYGPVYKAYLDHTPVAIKVLRPDAAQGRKQFQQEVEVLSCIRHPNMVLLLGACPEYGCLVYEFMDNGSLEDRLFRRGNTPTIPWSMRFKIAAEIATGLLFLHQTKPEPLVHRDLKPGNILLDRNYTSKISDVGLARLVPPSVADTVTQYRMTSTAGTFCYIDPEYQQTGMLGTKSDIYSLGVMLLQIITAKSPMGLTHHVERAIERGQFREMLDQSVSDWPVEEALVFAKLALKCAELRRKDRPDLGKVVLPELHRLRDIGYEHESALYGGGNGSLSVNAPGFGGFPPGNASRNLSSSLHKPRSDVHHEQAEPHPHLRPPWMKATDAP